jgi:hypothetical protein
VDRYLHEIGLVDQYVSFEKLRRRARISERAKSASAEQFSVEIRQATAGEK